MLELAQLEKGNRFPILRGIIFAARGVDAEHGPLKTEGSLSLILNKLFPI